MISNNNAWSGTKINESINVKFDVKSPINGIPEGKNDFYCTVNEYGHTWEK